MNTSTYDVPEGLISSSYTPMPDKKRKATFDASEKAARILDAVESAGYKQGRFINLCIELAESEAWQKLFDELKAAKKSAELREGRKNTGESTP